MASRLPKRSMRKCSWCGSVLGSESQCPKCQRFLERRSRSVLTRFAALFRGPRREALGLAYRRAPAPARLAPAPEDRADDRRRGQREQRRR